jgi:rhodanese-related sulfurtransferase
MRLLTTTLMSGALALGTIQYAQACAGCGCQAVKEKVKEAKSCATTCATPKKACDIKEACDKETACAKKKLCGKKEACDKAAACTKKQACDKREACAKGKHEKHAHDYKVIDIKQVEKAVGTEAVILDARGGKYLDNRRIPGAKALAAGSSAEDIAKALPDKDAAIITYCSNTKCPASKMLAHQLAELGYTNIQKYPGGIDAWEEAGKKVETVKE